MGREIRDRNGQFAGSVGDGVDAGLPADLSNVPRGEDPFASATQTETPAYAAMAEKAAAKTGPKNTGKDGTDAPPLSAKVKVGRKEYRVYAIDPATKAEIESGGLPELNKALAEGRAFPSITTCIGSLSKPALPAWAAGLSADHGEAVLRDVADSPDEATMRAKIEEQLEEIPSKYAVRTKFRKEAANAHNEARDKAAERGTRVHAIAEEIMAGGDPEVPEELEGYVESVKKFKNDYPDMEFVYTEATVHNPEAGTMGTTDAIVKVNGKYYVLDYKTSEKGDVYPEVGMQLSAAANAESIVHADGRREPMPPISGGLAVGLSPRGVYKLTKFETEKDGPNHRKFKAARDVWMADHFVEKPKVVKPGEL